MAKSPKSKPNPKQFTALEQYLLLGHDLNDWYANVFMWDKKLTGRARKLQPYEQKLLDEQNAHPEYYKKIRDQYKKEYEARQAALRTAPRSPSRSMQTDDPYFNPPRGWCSCTPSGCRCQ